MERYGCESVRVRAAKPEPPLPLAVQEVAVEVTQERTRGGGARRTARRRRRRRASATWGSAPTSATAPPTCGPRSTCSASTESRSRRSPRPTRPSRSARCSTSPTSSTPRSGSGPSSSPRNCSTSASGSRPSAAEPHGPRHGPRPLDVDLLLLGDLELESERLHPASPRGEQPPLRTRPRCWSSTPTSPCPTAPASPMPSAASAGPAGRPRRLALAGSAVMPRRWPAAARASDAGMSAAGRRERGTARRASSPGGTGVDERPQVLASSAAVACSPRPGSRRRSVPRRRSCRRRSHRRPARSWAGSFASAARAFSSVGVVERTARVTSGASEFRRRAVRHAELRFLRRSSQPRLRDRAAAPEHDLARWRLQLYVAPALDLQTAARRARGRPGRAVARAAAARAPGRSSATPAPGGRRSPSPGRCCRGTEQAEAQLREPGKQVDAVERDPLVVEEPRAAIPGWDAGQRVEADLHRRSYAYR